MSYEITPEIIKAAEEKRDVACIMTKSLYDIQKIRISMGNRITANFKSRLGYVSDGTMTEEDLEKESINLLAKIRQEYSRITDGVIVENQKALAERRFKPGEIITNYAEFCLVNTYENFLRNEEQGFLSLEKTLVGIPVYDQFLSQVAGVGPLMSAVLISYIDFNKCEYPSSLIRYAGLDTITYGKYTDEAGTEHIVPAWEVKKFYSQEGIGPEDQMLKHGKYVVQFVNEGRSKKKQSLEVRDYTDRNGDVQQKLSITFQPFLKTKLNGVLATSFLRATKSTVNGQTMGGAKREALAKTLGWKHDTDSVIDKKDQVIGFLQGRGYEIIIQRTEDAQNYDNYKFRIEHDPRHKDKTPLHRHNMAVRYMMQQFLNRLYNHGRRCNGLPVAPTYAEAKLGLIHGKVTQEKIDMVNAKR